MKYLWLLSLLIAILPLAAQEQEFYAADQSVFLLPTAYTMPAGTHAFTDIEVGLIQYAYAPVDRLHLSYGMVFPVVKDMFKTASFGLKYNYYKSDQTSTAIWTSYSPDPKMLTVGNIISWGNRKTSLHLGLGGLISMDEGLRAMLLGTGVIHSLSSRVSGIVEVDVTRVNPDSDFFGTGENISTDAFLGLGVRLKGQKISWDFGAVRQLTEDWGDVFAIPFIKATVLF